MADNIRISNVLGKIDGDPKALAGIRDGDPITVSRG